MYGLFIQRPMRGHISMDQTCKLRMAKTACLYKKEESEDTAFPWRSSEFGFQKLLGPDLPEDIQTPWDAFLTQLRQTPNKTGYYSYTCSLMLVEIQIHSKPEIEVVCLEVRPCAVGCRLAWAALYAIVLNAQAFTDYNGHS